MLVRLRRDRERGKRTNWLLIKRHDGYEREGDGEAVLEQDRSVASGRTMDEIAAGKGRSPKPFMLGKTKSFKADAIWHSNREASRAKPQRLRSSEGKAAAPRAQERRCHAELYRAAALQEREPPAIGARTGCMRSSLMATACSCASRTGRPSCARARAWTGPPSLPAIADAASGLPDCIIDGEVVALDHNGAPDFSALQAALSEGRSQRP